MCHSSPILLQVIIAACADISPSNDDTLAVALDIMNIMDRFDVHIDDDILVSLLTCASHDASKVETIFRDAICQSRITLSDAKVMDTLSSILQNDQLSQELIDWAKTQDLPQDSRERRPHEWDCPKCRYTNRPGQPFCNKCAADPPSEVVRS